MYNIPCSSRYPFLGESFQCSSVGIRGLYTMNDKPRLLNQFREQIRLKDYSIRIERVYYKWVERSFPPFSSFGMNGAAEVEAFLSGLAVRRNVSASSYNQTLHALLPTGCFWPTVLKKSATVSTAEKYALEIEIFTLSRGFGPRFRVAARKKGIFRSQYEGCLEGPTFSTQSAGCSSSVLG
ncbi:hypothetical protein PS850_01433 [Pseudomonas fluorescens]|nr:hypothetical protein PS850_01433 [Pseudomonas fluorescens]